MYMKKLFLAGWMVCISGILWAQNITTEAKLTDVLKGKNEVSFSHPKLTWNHFRKKADSKDGWTAMTYSGIKLRQRYEPHNNQARLYIDVYAYMDQSQSWYAPGADNPYTLSHEQLHFDITILIAKQLVQALNEATFSKRHYDREVQAIHKSYLQKLNEMQQLYDDETQNGQRASVQRAWERKIAQENMLLSKD